MAETQGRAAAGGGGRTAGAELLDLIGSGAFELDATAVIGQALADAAAYRLDRTEDRAGCPECSPDRACDAHVRDLALAAAYAELIGQFAAGPGSADV